MTVAVNHTPQTVRIVPFDWAYHDNLIALVTAIQRQEFGLPITAEDQPDLLNPAQFFRQEGKGEFWLAINDAQVVGCSGLIDCGNQTAALRKMFVHADWRGGPHGIAQSLLDISLAYAREHGFHQIILGTTDKFIAAHRFYERNGFHLIAPDQLPPAFPRMAVDTRFYALEL